METKVSIIVPVYDAEKYLEECIQSIISQTLSEIEIILVNDGSRDKSKKICEKYKEIDSRVKTIHQENAGASSARNTGIQMATGEYIGFVDADDWIINDMYEKMYNKATELKCDMVITDRIMDNGKNCWAYDYPRNTILDKDYLVNSLLAGYIKGELEAFVTTKLYRASIIKENNILFPDYDLMEDLTFNLEFVQHCNSSYFLDEKLYVYRHVESSIVNSYNIDRINSLQKIYFKKKQLIDKFYNNDHDVQIEAQHAFVHDITNIALNIFDMKEKFPTKMKVLKELRYSKDIIDVIETKLLFDNHLNNVSKHIWRLFKKKRYLLIYFISVHNHFYKRLKNVLKKLLYAKKSNLNAVKSKTL